VGDWETQEAELSNVRVCSDLPQLVPPRNVSLLPLQEHLGGLFVLFYLNFLSSRETYNIIYMSFNILFGDLTIVYGELSSFRTELLAYSSLMAWRV
jgi:hypothetical protein